MRFASNVLSRKIAFYMFGFEAIQCWADDGFIGQERHERSADIYMGVMRDFVGKIKKEHQSFAVPPCGLKI